MEYITPLEAAERLKVKRQTVYNWLKQGKLRGVKIGRLVRIDPLSLEEMMLRYNAGATAEQNYNGFKAVFAGLQERYRHLAPRNA